jgi:two-component system LytT family response regulator
MSTRTRVLIVDDEALARKLLAEMLEPKAEVEIGGEAANGTTAVQEIGRLEPDIVFLDVQMPELDGFGVIEALGDNLPAIVFVTAYDEYAVRAFDVEALDYLLKPFDGERVMRALERALTRVSSRETERIARAARRIVERSGLPPTRRSRIPIHVDGSVRFIEAGSIDWVEAEGKSVRIHRGAETIRTRQAISDLEDALAPLDFARVHRSALVNVAAIQEIQPWFHGDYVILLRNGAKVTSGRSYRDVVKSLTTTSR